MPMVDRIRGPRLSLRDVEDLMAAHVKASKVDEMLRGTNWQAAGACRILVGEIDMLIARLYNKAERVLVKPEPAESAESAQAAPAEIPAIDELGQGGNASPGKEET